jgi:GH43 family beta-xylosidase
MADTLETLNRESSTAGSYIILTSPANIPCIFSITIKDNGTPGGAIFEVSHLGDSLKTYTIGTRDHASYLNLFEQLSKDFGLRLPQNRQPAIAPTFKAHYREVLTENIAPGILYGYGDPAVLKVGDGDETLFYLVVTSNDAPDSFPILRSKNLVDWDFVQYVFPKGKKLTWAADGEMVSDYWAPEMHKVGEEFRIYFVARDKHTSELCIGMAKSSHPEEPFNAEADPILKDNVIDPHLFVEENNTVYLYWKEDNNDVWPGKLLNLLYENPALISVLFTNKEDQVTVSFIVTMWPWAQTLAPMERFQAIQVFMEAVISRYAEFNNHLLSIANDSSTNKEAISSVLHFMKTPMYTQQLTEDGTALTGERTKILENDLAWEAHLVEGMWVTKHKNKYYLFYAGNDFSTDQYGIGVAIADSPLGPFQKLQKQLLQSTAEWAAPGHPSVVVGRDGIHHMFLHAYFPGEAGYKKFRALLSIPLTLEKDNVKLHG